MGLTMGLCPGSHAVSLFFYQGHGSWNRDIGPDFTRQHFGCWRNWRNSDKAKAFQCGIQELHDLEHRIMSFYVDDFLPAQLQTVTCVNRETSSVKAHQYRSTELCSDLFQPSPGPIYMFHVIFHFFFLLLFPLMLFTTQSIHQEMKHLLVKDSICSLVFLRKFMLEMQPEVELEAIPDC